MHGDISETPSGDRISPTAIAHGSVLLGFFFAVKAWSYGLDRYLLLYGDNGVVVGASYTDIHVTLPVLWLLIGLSIVAAFAAWANLGVRTYRLPAAAAVLVFGGSIVLSGLIPGIFQRLFVKPNELQLEKPYIERNIALTQQAYNLRQITPEPFPAEQDLTFKTLEANKATIDNIRLWDWQPLMDSYMQLQEIRTYYKFHDVDVDRYWLDAAYQSVMLSARSKSRTAPAGTPARLPKSNCVQSTRARAARHVSGVSIIRLCIELRQLFEWTEIGSGSAQDFEGAARLSSCFSAATERSTRLLDKANKRIEHDDSQYDDCLRGQCGFATVLQQPFERRNGGYHHQDHNLWPKLIEAALRLGAAQSERTI